MFYDDRWPRRRLVDLMVRIKRANGTWEDLAEVKPAPEPFQRADGTRLTQDEIGRLGKADEAYAINARLPTTMPAPVRGPRAPKGQPTNAEAAAIEAVRQCGNTVDAARALGITRKALDSRLRKARARGVDVGSPWGKRGQAKPKPPPKPSPMNGASHRFAAVYEPLERQAMADAELDRRPEPNLVDRPPRPTTTSRASTAMPNGVDHLVPAADQTHLHPLLAALIEWLVEHAIAYDADGFYQWSQAWLAATKLVYRS